jgi:hypothetical protein
MSMFRFGQRLAVIVAGALLLFSVVGALPVAAKAPSWSHKDAHVCAQPGPDQARCTAIARAFYRDGTEAATPTKASLAVTAAAAAQSIYFNGTNLRTAYGLTATGDPSLVVAIVDAYDDPNAFANVSRFRSDTPGMPPLTSCSLATLTTLTSTAPSPCFTKTNQSGGTSLPTADAGWSNEIDLDLQAVSSICPMCSILLLEATSSSVGNLDAGVTTASNTGHVVAISNSYGISGDYPATLAPDYDAAAKKGIAVTASAGDGGYGPLFPASATNVLGVGGTTLAVDGSGVRTGETVWAGTGSGCSRYNSAPSWQTIPGNPCAGKKAISDLSAVADPNSGLAIYTTYNNVTGYWIFGGTSLSSPIIAALYATRGGYNAANLAGQVAWAAATPYFDVTSGKNTTGTCSPTVLCTAGTGWDGPTGLGSIAVANAAPVLTSITISPASASVQTGATKQFSATALDQFGQPMSGQTFSWSVDGDSLITQSGLLTAGPTTGPFTVMATSGGKSGTASLTVTTIPVLTTITVSPASASVQTGAQKQYTATGLDQSGQALVPQPAFTWSVTGVDNKVDSFGLVTAGATTGDFTVTATSGPKSGTASLTVTPIAPADFSLTVSPTARSIKRGGTASYTVTIVPKNGFNGPVTLSVSGQPSGSTATFSAIANGTSTLTIKTLATTPRQTYALTIQGVSGSLSHTTTASLTVH